MAYSAKQIATELLRFADLNGENLTPMKLQKLAYFAYGWYLAITGEPLIDEHVEAWKWGPVIPSLYDDFKSYGSDPITEPPSEIYFEDGIAKLRKFPLASADRAKDQNAKNIIKRVWDIYGKYSASTLSGMTHEPNSPWSITIKKDPRGGDIPDDLISVYFRKLANASNEHSAAPTR